MKPYLSTTGTLFLLITGAHVFEMIDRGHVEASDGVVLARTLRVKRLAEATLTLRATGTELREVYWFLRQSLLGKAAPGPSLAWLVR